ncbi:MAG TPA: D-sedoheptulose 7-phosphate isomerase [Nevskiaceae bacterium]|nr:D-sedoheptulose 7-phosphate isomerase [Nevskiaceae bacterium]
MDGVTPPDISLGAVRAMIADSVRVKQQVLEDQALQARTLAVAQLCIEALQRGNKILLAGNGGSAADSQHIAAEFVSRFEFDRPGLPAIAMTTDTSMLTAIGNDYGYELLFARQLQAQSKPGDVFIGITTSGNSKNIVKAMELARGLGVTTVALCGASGKVHELADHVLAVPSTHTPRIQESHILLGHVICALCEEAIFPQYKKPKP